MLAFAELEFTHAVGPDAGRYLLEGGDVLLISVRGAPAGDGGSRRRRRVRTLDPAGGDAAVVPLAIVRFVRCSEPLADAAAGQALAERWTGDPAERDRWIVDALAALNRAVAAFRVAAQNPYVVEVARADARAVRLGWGTPDDVDRGDASELLEVPGGSRRRLPAGERAQPAEVVAAVLAGRITLDGCHDLLLRALLDVAHGRPAAARAGVMAALHLATARASGLGLVDLRADLEALVTDAGSLDAAELADRCGALLDRLRAHEASAPRR